MVTAILSSLPIGMSRPYAGTTAAAASNRKMPWLCLVIAACLSVSSCHSGETGQATEETVPAGAQRLIDAYPEQNLRYSRNRIIFPDGTSFIYDDGEQKDFTAKVDNPDIEDMLSMEYEAKEKPDYMDDPGRIRCDGLFKKMYGRSSSKVFKKLVMVPWFGSEVSFTSVNGAAGQLAAVEREIRERYPELTGYMECAGTFYWRKIQGTDRLSAHSFGIAIDIGIEHADYWRWKHKDATETSEIAYENRIPMEIVGIFEKHGFIWGGRWYHFDTMHFEYRPEMMQKDVPLS